MTAPATNDARPVLIYDGDCGFCAYWARYWQQLTGDAVRYAPYQQVAADYPQIELAEFRRAVQYVTPDGRVASAAEASFRTLSHAPGKGFWLALYRHLPGFASISERAYAFIAAHRPAAHRVSLLLWGRDHGPPRFELTVWLFLRGLALIYLAAFLSFGSQVTGLVGSQGILPLQDFLAAAAQRFATERFWLFPTLFWFDASDIALKGVCWAGALLSVLLLVNVLPRLSLALLFVLYLALFYAGQVFTNFQWDLLLLETGFLALALSTGSQLSIWLARWLAFRFIFMSGLVKVLSGDASWAKLAALRYHFETQPLPTPLAWYANQLSDNALRIATGATLWIELALPFLIFLPRRARFVTAWGFLALQVLILLTGNYNFFNLLALLLCLPLFDDAALSRVLPTRLVHALKNHIGIASPGIWARGWVAVYAAISVLVGTAQIISTLGRSPLSKGIAEFAEIVAPLRVVNRYGPFANMTTERPEIVIEGSRDGEHWREYAFKYKPGDVNRRPSWNIPHQPRLDWQMWFAALGTQDQNRWFGQLLLRLLQNSPAVVALLARNPYSDAPPTYVRALLYEYRFADAQEKKQGQWWTRQLIGIYYPPVQLPEQGR
jgi:predicted DCC family thiol-disulfide oxidoreductase YuxK